MFEVKENTIFDLIVSAGGNTAGVFSLSGTGVLTLAQTVTSGNSYTLVIEAQDGGTPVKSGEITVTLSTISGK